MNRGELWEYLDRIGIGEMPTVDAAGLAAVQRAHLFSVPFENLDIIEGKIPLDLSEAALFDKIVRRRRGGICYEQNLLFAAALRAMGFEVALKGGRHPKYGDDMDHLFLLVNVPSGSLMSASVNNSTNALADGLVDAVGAAADAPADLVSRAPGGVSSWLADVGFADNFAAPIRLLVGDVQSDGVDRYVIREAPEVGAGYLRLMRVPGVEGDSELAEMFAFGPREYEAKDCRRRCDWFSTAPESRFVQGPFVTIQGVDGRKTLSARHYIETRGGIRNPVDLESSAQYERYLHEVFGL